MLISLLIAFVPVRMFCNLLDGGTIGISMLYEDIKPGGFLYFAFCFLPGAALFASRHSLDKLRHRPVMLDIGAVALASSAIAFNYVDGVFGHRRTASTSMSDAVTGSAFAAVSALSWSFLLLGVTHALVKHSNALVRWLVELSYPLSGTFAARHDRKRDVDWQGLRPARCYRGNGHIDVLDQCDHLL